MSSDFEQVVGHELEQLPEVIGGGLMPNVKTARMHSVVSPDVLVSPALADGPSLVEESNRAS